MSSDFVKEMWKDKNWEKTRTGAQARGGGGREGFGDRRGEALLT